MTETKARSRKNAVRLRARVKRKKPKFVRPESWRYFRLKETWRHPRGLDHKVRLMYKGWPPAAGAGYGGPRASRGLHPSGFREVLVYNVEQLGRIDPETQAARIAHRVGKRKRAGILAEARRKKIVVLNLREIKEAPSKEAPEEGKEGKPETQEESKKEETATESTEVEEEQAEEKPKRRRGRTKEQ